MELDAEAIRREKAEIVARYGEWTAHNIHFVDDAADRHGAVMMIDRDAVLITSPQVFQCH